MNQPLQIFEAVPNISEARNTTVIKSLATTIKSVKDCRLLDSHSDNDHNRTVFTYIGTKEGVTEASLKLIKLAYKLIDLTQHKGVHPFSGVVDVLPIIPVLNCTLNDANVLAHNIGEKASQTFKVPLFYYESSAQNTNLTSLPSIRKHLKTTITKTSPSGVLIIGARDFLVAYNINITNGSLELVKQIASQIRERDGGLPFVRALGLELKNQKTHQVSTNLINPFVTTPEMTFRKVTRIIRNLDIPNIEISEEVVGMLPQNVLQYATNLEEEINGKNS